ncbi:MAG: DUF3368 domain-containing protein [Nodosilinea sp. LVE1205-7]|jgi:hypothetical protein
MNAVEIEEAVSQLAEAPFDPNELCDEIVIPQGVADEIIAVFQRVRHPIVQSYPPAPGCWGFPLYPPWQGGQGGDHIALHPSEIRYSLGGYADSAVTWLQQTGQAFIQAVPAIDSRVANWDLGLGESHVLSWVIHHPVYEAIIDDLAARKAAKILPIPVRGTLAIIVLAKQMGYISSAQQDLENLVRVGLRISPAVLNQALALVGE